MGKTPRRRRAAGSAFRQADRYVGVGFQVAMSLVVYVLVGNWLDKRLGTDPWLTLLGALLGFASMMFLLVRFAATASRNGRKPKGNGKDEAAE